MVLYPLLDMRGGASLCKSLEIPGGFGVSPVIGVSGVATTGQIWAESQKIPLVIGGIQTGNLTLGNDVANRLIRRRRRHLVPLACGIDCDMARQGTYLTRGGSSGGFP